MIDYIQNYVEARKNFKALNISIDLASLDDLAPLNLAKEEALNHSGLNEQELELIAGCRQYLSEYFWMLNTYYHQLRRAIQKENK